jgi:hypothetical protein
MRSSLIVVDPYNDPSFTIHKVTFATEDRYDQAAGLLFKGEAKEVSDLLD